MNGVKQLGVLVFFLLLQVSFNSWSQEIHSHTHSIQTSFVENKGQWNENILFKSSVDGGNIWVQQGKLLYHLTDYSNYAKAHANFTSEDKTSNSLKFSQTVVHLNFQGANRIEEVVKLEKSKQYYNFFKGKDRSKWVGGVCGYNEIVLEELYDGIHLRLFQEHHQIKYQFEVSPTYSADQIVLNYANHKRMKVNSKGELIIKTDLGNIIEGKPYAYQIINGKVIEVEAQYSIEGDQVQYVLGHYNKNYELVIDPTLVFATYNGAISDNFGMTATYGYDGTAYVAGTVFGNNYPIPDSDAYDISSNFTVANVGVVTTDAFISKYDPSGSSMLWATFYGGGDDSQGTDVPHSLICDTLNNIYVYGVTSSLDFPIENGVQQNHAGGQPLVFNSIGTNFGNTGTDIYVAKFSDNGHSLLGSTYIGGTHNDGVNYKISSGGYSAPNDYDSLSMNYGDQLRGEIMLDEDNNVLVASCSRSSDFPLESPFQGVVGGQQDGVIFKLKHDFSELMWSSYFGGSENDGCYSVKLNSQNEVLFTGGTASNDISIPQNGYQLNNAGGKVDGFVVRLSADGTVPLSASYIGTSSYDQAYFVEVDMDDKVYILGQTLGTDFPVVGNVYTNNEASQFISVFSSDLSNLELSTVFGSSTAGIDISPAAFLVDICGNVYVSGWGRNLLQNNTTLSGMPITANAFQSQAANGFDFYLMVLERDLTGLLYGTYMGGGQAREHVDGGTSRFDKNGEVYQGVCGGCGGSSDFPTTPDAWSNENLASNCNALVFKFDFNLIPSAEFTVSQTQGCVPFEVTFENTSSSSDSYYWDFGDGQIDSTTFNPTIVYNDVGQYEVQLFVTDSICMITDTALVVVEVFPGIDLSPLEDVYLCQSDFVSFVVETNGAADEYVWSLSPDFSDPLNDSFSDSTVNFLMEEEGYVYVRVRNEGCERIDSAFVSFTGPPIDVIGEVQVCSDEPINYYADFEEGAYEEFYWFPEELVVSGNGSSVVELNFSTSGFIYLAATSESGCDVLDSVFVEVGSVSSIDLDAIVSDSIVPSGSVVQLEALPDGYSYQWYPADGVVNPSDQTSEALVNQDTWFVVEVTDGVCVKSDSVLVKTFEYKCEEPYIFVPNAFTPNGDGENDVLFARSSAVDFTRSFVFRVFNRWGEMVFETDDVTRGWDGTWRDKELAPDVYDYYVEGFCLDGQEFFMKGNVTLIR